MNSTLHAKACATLLTLLLASCSVPSESGLKVIVGARLDQPPLEHSVVVIAGGKIRAVGAQSAVPVPKGSDIIGGLGMTIEPLPGAGPIEAGAPANLILKGPSQRLMRDGEWVQ